MVNLISASSAWLDYNSSSVYARASSLQVATNHAAYQVQESYQTGLVHIKTAKPLSYAAQFYAQQVAGSQNLSDSQKHKLLQFIAQIDAQDGFETDESGSISAAVGMMIQLSEQANQAKGRQYDAMDAKTASAIITATLNKPENLKDQSYILSTRLLAEQFFFEMNGQSLSVSISQSQQSLQALNPGTTIA